LRHGDKLIIQLQPWEYTGVEAAGVEFIGENGGGPGVRATETKCQT